MALPFHLHVIALIAILAGLVSVVRVSTTRRERLLGSVAVAGFAAVTLWPVGDVAASVSLSVATLQRLVLMLLVAPLMMLAAPTSTWVAVTRPAFVDAVARRLVRPVPALAIVTIVGTFTLSVPVVDWGARSLWARDLIIVGVVALGVVLWLPALGLVPGARRLSEVARAAYVFVAALVVTSLSLVWIFAKHPLYPALHSQQRFVHLSPLADQQVAGFVAKLGAYLPMWIVAFVIFSRADQRGVDLESSPLHWADVERELLRAERQRRRAHARTSAPTGE
ncbi:MAG: cytochrome c oxidase assembly protein [Acidobacteriota bacterium]|nr:cytochrome c oxidase assembly protein [Acidobacteriota bacterium]MDE3108066.1 cytochrome c oxidase assembly protein [Acidobacteriota bacterium]